LLKLILLTYLTVNTIAIVTK